MPWKRSKLSTGIVLLGLIIAAPVLACDVTLEANGNTAAIQHAIDKALKPIVICLKSGLYPGARLIATHSVTLKRLGNGPVLLDAGTQGRIVTLQQNGLVVNLIGLTLKNGRADRGGAISMTQNSKITLQDCVLDNNEATVLGGGAIFADAGQVEVVRTLVSHNIASFASAIEGTGTAKMLFDGAQITDNNTKSTGDAPVRLSNHAQLVCQHSTIAYNGGGAILLMPGAMTQLSVDSSIVMGAPEAIAVHRLEVERVRVKRSVVHGGIGNTATDLATSRGLPDFAMVEPERYRPRTGSPAIAIGQCQGAESRTDLLGRPRAKVCTAGALEAAPDAIKKTMLARAKLASEKAQKPPW